MLKRMRAHIEEAKKDITIVPNYQAYAIAVPKIANELNYTTGLATQCVMAMQVSVSAGNEEIAAEMMVSGAVMAKLIVDKLGGGPDAVLEACRHMEIDF